jgi:hypothetical protein
MKKKTKEQEKKFHKHVRFYNHDKRISKTQKVLVYRKEDKDPLTYNKKQITNEKAITVVEKRYCCLKRKKRKKLTRLKYFSKKKNLFVAVSSPSMYLEKVEQQ